MTAWFEIENRSQWTLDGTVVIVRGVSSVMVWYTVVGGPDVQLKMLLTQFLKKARRV